MSLSDVLDDFDLDTLKEGDVNAQKLALLKAQYPTLAVDKRLAKRGALDFAEILKATRAIPSRDRQAHHAGVTIFDVVLVPFDAVIARLEAPADALSVSPFDQTPYTSMGRAGRRFAAMASGEHADAWGAAQLDLALALEADEDLCAHFSGLSALDRKVYLEEIADMIDEDGDPPKHWKTIQREAKYARKDDDLLAAAKIRLKPVHRPAERAPLTPISVLEPSARLDFSRDRTTLAVAHRLVVGMFRIDDLQLFVARNYSHLQGSINWGGPLNAVAFDVLRCIERHTGRLDAAFFLLVRDTCPGRAADHDAALSRAVELRWR